jgi:hypothetical protein
MNIKLLLLISALSINTTWAAASDSTSMAPGDLNNGVYTINVPQTYANS